MPSTMERILKNGKRYRFVEQTKGYIRVEEYQPGNQRYKLLMRYFNNWDEVDEWCRNQE